MQTMVDIGWGLRKHVFSMCGLPSKYGPSLMLLYKKPHFTALNKKPHFTAGANNAFFSEYEKNENNIKVLNLTVNFASRLIEI